MRLRAQLAAVMMVVALACPTQGLAEGRLATLTLDGLSFLSFEGVENLPIPSGSKIGFRFGGTTPGSSAAFTVSPEDSSIAPIPLGGALGNLTYRLAKPATGTLSRTDNGYALTFTAEVSVTRADGGTTSSTVRAMRFTTENAASTGTKTGATVSLDGLKVVPEARYVQLVGATSNSARSFPHPGRAVYTVLSGTFDWLPALE